MTRKSSPSIRYESGSLHAVRNNCHLKVGSRGWCGRTLRLFLIVIIFAECVKVTVWRPILDGNWKVDARVALELIELHLRYLKYASPVANAEVALFYAYMSLKKPDRYRPVSLHFLECALGAAHSLRPSPALFGGATDLAWTVSCVGDLFNRCEGTELSGRGEDLLVGFDRSLLRFLEQQTHGKYNCSLASGLAGIGVYCLERLPRISALKALSIIIDRLREYAHAEPGDVSWLLRANTADRLRAHLVIVEDVDQSTARGISGIAGFLLRVCKECAALTETASALLTDLLRFLVKKSGGKKEENSISLLRPPDHIEAGSSQLGWCCGELGIAVVLQLASLQTGDRDAALASEILFRRSRKQTSGISSAGLCHGAIGVAHLFNRSYQRSGNQLDMCAARFWYRRGLHMLLTTSQHAPGFFDWIGGPPPDPANFSLLTGSVGIGLALFAAITNIEPDWDRKLAMSSR